MIAVRIGLAVAAAVLVFLCAFHPPWDSAVGLDPSWQIGLTEAHDRALQFGTDIVFTYGPLGYLIMGAANQQTYAAMLACSIAIALLCAGLVLSAAAEPGSIGRKLIFVSAMMIVFAAIRRELLYVIIIAWTLAAFRDKKPAPLAAFVLGAFSGVASLAKFEFALAAGVGGFLLFAVRAALARRNGVETQGHVVAFLTFSAGFLGAYGFPFARFDYGAPVALALAALLLSSATLGLRARRLDGRVGAGVAFLSSLLLALSPSCRAFTIASLQISSGYSSAMSVEGDPLFVVLALCCAVLLGLLVVANLQVVTLPVAIALAVAIFVSFKEGFVREDGHVIGYFLAAFLVAGAVARFSAGRRLFAIGLTCVLLLLFALNVVAGRFGYPDLAATPFSLETLSQEASGVAAAVSARPSDVARAFADNLASDRLPDAVRLEIGTQTAEALPSETSAIAANDLRWDPEPVFQTYQVDTQALDDLNASHLEQHGAARILYAWDAIDGRYPFWDQPAAHEILLCRYRVDDAVSSPVYTRSGIPMLLLSRTLPRCGEPQAGAAAHYGWDQQIPVGQPGAGLTFANISIRYSIAGQLMKTFYRIPPVYVRVTAEGTSDVSYRFLAETAGDGVLIDPFPQTLRGVESVLQRVARPRAIRSFSIHTNAPYLYEPDVTVRFVSVRYR